MLEELRARRAFDDALAVPVLMTYASAHPIKSDNIVLKKKKKLSIEMRRRRKRKRNSV